MAHFYGRLQGSRGEATRCGTAVSGLRTVAASWQGCVQVVLYHNETSGEDCARITLAPWHGRGKYVELYDGPVAGAPMKSIEL